MRRNGAREHAIFVNVRIDARARREFWKRAGFTLAAVVCLASAAPAQRNKNAESKLRDVQGIVVDANSQPVAGAIVQLKNTKTLQIISFITKDQGDYYFHGLSPEIDFELTATKGDKESATRTLSSFDTRKQAVMNLKLVKDKK